MDRFLNLTYNPKSHVPPISSIIEGLVGDKNRIFYMMGNWLHSTEELNTNYTLVSIREIINLCALSKDKMNNPDELNPVNSYKWLYLLNSISSRKVDDSDAELDQAKNEYVLNAYLNCLQNIDLSVKFAPEFIAGVITSFARYVQSYKCDLTKVITDESYKALIKLLNHDFQQSNEEIQISSFSNPSLFYYLSPLPQSFYQKMNLFQKVSEIIHVAIIRLLLRVIPSFFPDTTLEDLKLAIFPLCVSGSIVETALNVLKMLFKGDEDAAFRFKDTILYQRLSSSITKYAGQTQNFKHALSCQGAIELSRNLIDIKQLSSKHPNVWAKYLTENPSVEEGLEHLMSSSYDPTFINLSVSLLTIGSGSIKNITLPVDLFISTTSKDLRNELHQLLLDQPELTAQEICRKLKAVCNHGSNSAPVFDLLADILKKVADPAQIVNRVIESIQKEYSALVFHPNSFLYTQLQNYIDVSASYLDEQPCNVCSNPERVPRSFSQKDVVDGSKYTHEKMLFKFKKPLLISNVSFKFNVKKRDRTPKVIKFLISMNEISSTSDLLGPGLSWREIGEMKFTKDEKTGNVTFPLPLFATCFCIYFTEFWEDNNDGRPLMCPKCHSTIDNRSGICSKCGESVFQCKQCRNINYNISNPFICSECGNSNFIDMSWTLSAIESFSHTRINSHSDIQASLAKCDKLLEQSRSIFDDLMHSRERIEDILSPTNVMTVTERIQKLNSLYNDGCKNSFQQLTSIVQHVTEIRKGISQFLGHTAEHDDESENMCYNCRQKYINNCLRFLSQLAEIKESDTLEASKLLIKFIDVQGFTEAAVYSLVAFCRIRPELTERVVNMFIQSLPKPSFLVVRLLSDVLKIDDEFKVNRFTSILNALVESVKHEEEDSSMMPIAIAPLVQSLFTSPLIIKEPDMYTLYSSFYAWCGKRAKKSFIEPLDMLPLDTLKSLLLCSNSEVRKHVEDFLEEVCVLPYNNYDRVLKFVTGIIEEIMADSGSHSHKKAHIQQVMNVFSYLNNVRETTTHMLQSDFFVRFVAYFEREVSAVFRTEGSLGINLLNGFNVMTLADIIHLFLDDGIYIRYVITHRPQQLEAIIRSYFLLRSIIIQKTSYLEAACKVLKKIAIELLAPQLEIYSADEAENEDGDKEPVTWSNETGQKLAIRTAFSTIGENPTQIVNEIHDVIFPKKETLNFEILLRKIQSQEDFIPGRTSSKPVWSHDIGTLMRDLKNKICNDLDMRHLIEDDHGMELLVSGNIISLDLPLEDVYRNVWCTQHPNEPMLVIFRLQGLDGEATEPMISSFPSNAAHEEPPEIKFKYTSCLADGDSFAAILDNLSSFDYGTISNAMHILNSFSSIRENRAALNRLNGIEKLFAIIATMIKDEGVTPEDLEPVLKLANTLVHDNPGADKTPSEHVSFVLETLKLPLVRNNDSLMSLLLGFLQPLASRSPDLMTRVLEFFINGLKPAEATGDFNFFANPRSLYLLNSFAEFVSALKDDKSGNSLRDVIADHTFVSDAVSELTSLFPLSEDIKSAVWEQGVNKNTVPAILKFLAGMVLSNSATQRLFTANDSFVIRLLLKLRNVASSNNIGELADNVLSSASQESSVCAEQISAIREREAAAEKELFQRQREAIMSEQQNDAAMDDLLNMLGDQDEVSCCICKEGYDYLPDQPLGVYAFLSHDGPNCHIATHFVWIHEMCHQSELTNRTQRQMEWEMAAVRNCEAPCNTIFPIPGPKTTQAQYRKMLSKCYGSFRNSDSVSPIMNDIAYHMQKVAAGECIPRKFGGGSQGNDVKVIPFLVYAAQVLMNEGTVQDNTDARSNMEKMLQKMLTKSNQNVFGFALCILSLEEWNAAKLKVLESLLKPVVKGVASEERFAAAKNTLIAFIIADVANRTMKQNSGIAPEIKDGIVQIRSHNGEKWISEIMNTIANDQITVLNTWQDIADQLEDEFLPIDNIQTVFEYTNISQVNGQQWLESL